MPARSYSISCSVYSEPGTLLDVAATDWLEFYIVLVRENADGRVPTYSGDVIVKVAKSNVDDVALQRAVGRTVGRIVHETLPLPEAERPAEIERRVRAALAALPRP